MPGTNDTYGSPSMHGCAKSETDLTSLFRNYTIPGTCIP